MSKKQPIFPSFGLIRQSRFKLKAFNGELLTDILTVLAFKIKNGDKPSRYARINKFAEDILKSHEKFRSESQRFAEESRLVAFATDLAEIYCHILSSDKINIEQQKCKIEELLKLHFQTLPVDEGQIKKLMIYDLPLSHSLNRGPKDLAMYNTGKFFGIPKSSLYEYKKTTRPTGFRSEEYVDISIPDRLLELILVNGPFSLNQEMAEKIVEYYKAVRSIK